MADGRVTIDTRIDPGGAVTGLKSLKKPLMALAGKLGGIMASVFALNKLIDFKKESEELYKIQMTNETKLETITRQRMNLTKAEIQSLKDLASAQQELGVIGDEVQLAGMQQLSTFLTSKKAIEKLLPAMNNLIAQQEGLNASVGGAVNVGNLIGKVMQGSTGALTRVGITFSEAEEKALKFGNEEQRAAVLAKIINNNVGEMNKALANTNMGRQQQLANTVGDVKEKFGQAFQTISTLFIPVLQKLAKVADMVANHFIALANAIAKVFGTKNITNDVQNTANSNVKSIEDVEDATDDLTESEKEQEKQMRKTLRGWDELNNITSDMAEEQEDIADNALDAGDILDVADPLEAEDILSDNIPKYLDELKNRLEALREYLAPYWEQIKNQWQQSWEGIKSVWQPVLEGIWEDVKSLAEPLKTAFKDYVIPAFASITSDIIFVFGKLVEDVGIILGGIWENLVFPSADSFVKNAIPVFAEVAEQISNTFKIAFDEINKLFVKFWEGTINPLLALMGKIISNIFEDMKAVWDEKGKPVFDSINEAIRAVGEYLNSLYDNILKPVFDYIIQQANEIWDEHLREAFKDIGLAIMEIIEFLGHFITGIASAKTELTQTFGSDIVAVINSFVAIMSDAIKTVLDKLDGFIQMVQGLFMILNGLFTNDTEKMLAGADKVWDGFFKGIEAMGKYMVNSIINLLNLLIAKINYMASVASGIISSISTSMGGSAISIPKIPSIPKLATGAVIPANKPFMAMLGDQKQGTNIEAPLDTIKQALSEVMQGYSGGNNGDIVVQIDGREIFRAVRNQNEDYKRMTGKGAFA